MKSIGTWFMYLYFYLRPRPLQTVGLVISLFSILMILIGPYIIPYSPTTGVDMQLLPPSAEYWFGTDVNGMCVFSRTMAAYRTDLAIVLVGAILSFIVGLPLGILSGYFDGQKGFLGMVSTFLLRSMDVFQSFPIFVLGLLLVAIFGPNWINLMLLIAVANLPANLRMARTGVLSIRNNNFVDAARVAGSSELRIAFAHIAPNVLSPVIALLSVVMGFGILLVAGLSFVGAGVRAPTPEWGAMIAQGSATMMTGEWWPSLFPGFFMALTVFGFSMVGDIITAMTDPLQRITLRNSLEGLRQKKAAAAEAAKTQAANSPT